MKKDSVRNRLNEILNQAPELQKILISSDSVKSKKIKIRKFLSPGVPIVAKRKVYWIFSSRSKKGILTLSSYWRPGIRNGLMKYPILLTATGSEELERQPFQNIHKLTGMMLFYLILSGNYPSSIALGL